MIRHAALLLAAVTVACTGPDVEISSEASPQPTVTVTVTETVTEMAEPRPVETITVTEAARAPDTSAGQDEVVLGSFSGQGSGETAPFWSPENWVFSWTVTGEGTGELRLLDEDGLRRRAVPLQPGGVDEVVIEEAGTWYFEVDADDRLHWEVVARKPPAG